MVAMTTGAVADDDTSSSGVDNPGYMNGQTQLDTFTNDSPSPPQLSPVSSELPQQSELVRDPSVMREDSGFRRWRRRPGKQQERPGLNRLVSDMSDISNSTTSTFVSWTASQRSDPELN